MARDSDTATTPAARPQVFYDGACPLCRAEIGFYERRGVEAGLTDVSRDDAALPDGLSRETALKRFHVIDEAGRLRSGMAAFAALWRATPGWRLVGRVAGTPPLVWIGEAAYRGFLVARPALQALARRLETARR